MLRSQKSSKVALLLLFWFCVSAQSAEPVTIYLAGDSTMAQKIITRRPETGWGEQLQQFFDFDAVRIENHARNGRSTRTFLEEGRWARVVGKLKSGDYVFIQFGHNDSSADKPDRYTAPPDYRANLLRFIADVRSKDATPVLLTPVMRRRFDEHGKLQDSHGVYPDIVREVAKAQGVTLLDMHRDSAAYLNGLGRDASIKLFMILQPGESPNYPQGLDDNTHFTPAGALEMAKIAAKEIAASNLPIAKSLQSR
jgi:lysophospholipase L1-like esterase